MLKMKMRKMKMMMIMTRSDLLSIFFNCFCLSVGPVSKFRHHLPLVTFASIGLGCCS